MYRLATSFWVSSRTPSPQGLSVAPEGTKFILGRMLRTSTNDDIVESILEMHKNGTLCRIDEDHNKQKDPTIICSMGLKI